jgi:hypothetical protein
MQKFIVLSSIKIVLCYIFSYYVLLCLFRVNGLPLLAPCSVNAGHVLKDQSRIENCRRIVEEVHNRMTRMTGRGEAPPVPMPVTETQAQQKTASMRSEVDDRRQHSQQAGPGPSSIHLKLSSATALSAAAQHVARSSAMMNTTMRCLCGNPAGQKPGPALKCQGETCGIWQHQLCLYQQPDAADKRLLEEFYCESCRSARADPFWDVVTHDIVPMATLKKTQKQVLVRMPAEVQH